MRISEKTLELTLCAQLSVHASWRSLPHHPFASQPLWFGLTQKQEARAGFDAAARLGRRQILLLQFKAGRRLTTGIRYKAPHQQLQALKARVAAQYRLVYYVLPETTRTSDLQTHPWVLERTWWLDVAAIPPLAPPSRASKEHLFTLDAASGSLLITSDPVRVQTTRLVNLFQWSRLGGTYENFDKFWSYAGLLGEGAVACAVAGAA